MMKLLCFSVYIWLWSSLNGKLINDHCLTSWHITLSKPDMRKCWFLKTKLHRTTITTKIIKILLLKYPLQSLDMIHNSNHYLNWWWLSRWETDSESFKWSHIYTVNFQQNTYTSHSSSRRFFFEILFDISDQTIKTLNCISVNFLSVAVHHTPSICGTKILQSCLTGT